MLDFYELVWMETKSLTSKESQKDIAYTGVLHIHLDERDSRTEDQQGLRPNGFTKPTTMSDFPVRDRSTWYQDLGCTDNPAPNTSERAIESYGGDSQSFRHHAVIVHTSFPNATLTLDCIHIMKRAATMLSRNSGYGIARRPKQSRNALN